MAETSTCKFRNEGPWASADNQPPADGTRLTLEGKEYVCFDNHWIRYYAPPADSLAARKKLIDHLTRRTFHHTEAGINTPGRRLEAARNAYDNEQDPSLKRVNAAMLAGALFNRATDIFTTIVDLEEKGVKIGRDNELMKVCSQCFKEALELGKQVKHHSGEEGIDELWGEPFRAFTCCMKDYYESRYIKIAQTMTNIDQLADAIKQTFAGRSEFPGLETHVDRFASAAKCETETMKIDENIFVVWPQFIAAGESLAEYQPIMPVDTDQSKKRQYGMAQAQQTLRRGAKLINWVARARVPMPRSTNDYLQSCREIKLRLDNL